MNSENELSLSKMLLYHAEGFRNMLKEEEIFYSCLNERELKIIDETVPYLLVLGDLTVQRKPEYKDSDGSIQILPREFPTLEKAQLRWEDWLGALDTKEWYDGKHFGDCTKECNTCMRCLVNNLRREAEDVLDLVMNQ